ncbi:YheC/YheD family protein [Paenibacillus sediminis]|uniref:YheC/YheD family protein n=1 Tax=Paenibacillus sediminis TaxID=664909 RepID=UPI0031587615
MKRYLEQFALSLAQHLDKIYGKSFDELGIDVGLDSNRQIQLYEVNWRPGVPPSFYYEIDVARNLIRYAIYLAAQKRR